METKFWNFGSFRDRGKEIERKLRRTTCSSVNFSSLKAEINAAINDEIKATMELDFYQDFRLDFTRRWMLHGFTIVNDGR